MNAATAPVGTLFDAIELSLGSVRGKLAAALILGDDLEAGRIIRQAVDARLAEWRDLEKPDVPTAELEAAFRDVFAADTFGPRLAVVPVKEMAP